MMSSFAASCAEKLSLPPSAGSRANSRRRPKEISDLNCLSAKISQRNRRCGDCLSSFFVSGEGSIEQAPLQGRDSPAWWTWMPSEFCLPAEAAGFLVDFEQAKGRMLWVKFIEAVLADIVIPAAHGGG
jgi:hypothetical protein